jgi:peptidoglycan hydrolase CwlO-like protein
MGAFEMIVAILGSNTITGVFTWWGLQKRSKVEVQKLELENIQQVIGIWKDLAQDLSEEVNKLTTRCEQLSAIMEETKAENIRLQQEVARLNTEIKALNEIIIKSKEYGQH